jgi:hypothetical protein
MKISTTWVSGETGEFLPIRKVKRMNRRWKIAKIKYMQSVKKLNQLLEVAE